MRFALIQAGFQVLGDTEVGVPGLRVTEVSAGALVSWTASDEFAALARERGGGCVSSHDSIRVIVKVAVSGLLLRLGHSVAETAADGDLLVLADTISAPDSGDR
ncbi:hypothetical protein C6Y14_01590 [Streptomyces dioscori]|uniref:Uncharacterized protein n=1 Tax=Streptomyces dioscori TaxID=2109333 RepID=A0A2P8QF06_9ACTN|nr:hypothetical protein [Streptomyces dioscori]PSM44841.1 hypothetical protein C6Y14_01590 [Streptomyces dioscori]